MKKFLSLLLTLTMVLSLAVVPARADTPEDGSSSEPSTPAAPRYTSDGTTPTISVSTNTTTVTGAVPKGTPLTFTAVTEGIVIKKDGNALTAPVFTYTWGGSVGGDSASTAPVNATGSSITATCIVSVKENSGDENPIYTFPIVSVTVPVYDCASAVTGVTLNNRLYTKPQDGNITVYHDADELTSNPKWGVTTAKDYSVVTTEGYPKYESNSLKVKIKYDTVEDSTVEVSIPITATQISATSLAADKSRAKTGEKVTFTLTATKSDFTKLAWYYKSTAENSQYVPMTVTKNQSGGYEWIIPNNITGNSAEGTYTVTCFLKESGTPTTADTVKAVTSSFTIAKDENKLTYTSTVSAARGSTVNLRLTFTDKDGNKIDNALSNVAWEITSGTGATLGTKKVSDDEKTASNTLTVNSNSTASSYTVTATFNVGGKDYTATFTVRVNALTATLSSSVQNGGNVPLYTTGTSNYYNSLATIAQNAIYRQLGKNVSVTFASVSKTSSTKGTLSSTASNGYFVYSAPKSYIGSDTLTITASASDGNTYYVTLTIPVTPILNTSFGSVNAELVSTTGSTYGSYKVYFPTSYARFYVLNQTGTAPSDWTGVSLGSSYSSSTPYTLNVNSSNYNNGQVTLYVVAQLYTSGSSTEYYAGPLTVYLQSNDIEYTGVAGTTVNFQHSSFTTFLNAMNTSSSTYYYEFQDVTFSYFNSSTQGTLYYGSTAMTSGSYSSSSYFNSATKITNLDNVSFAIKSTIPSSVKTISIPFQLHAKQYRSGSYSSSFVSDVTFSGRVVISVAREDIVINVAAGDAVKLDATAFLNYLRNSSTSYRNANIDYVTFSQNLSVSSSNSAYTNGALYTYYTNSYSFGNPVTSTDRFYYSTTTYNVNRLSDVAFRANTYATAGTTVYIPFTIKLLNSNATVTGTLAAKIANAVNFYDVTPGAYYYDAVKWAVGAGVTKGTGNNMFSPAKSCTRAEIVTFLWRAAGSPAPKRSSSPFTDVYSGMGSDFYNAILWAVGEGITTGTTTSKFSPNDTCTRGQIVTFLHRYLKTPSGYYSNPFKDIKSGYYCYNAVIWAYGSGVAKGTSATTFSPDATCTRGDAVTFLYRALVK